MKLTKSILIVALASALGAVAGAQNVINLATGLDSSGNLQTAGDLLDANWTIVGGDNMKNGASVGQAFTVDSTNPDWGAFWQTNGPNSSWIAQDPDNSANGNMTATRTFNLTSAQLATATFANLGVSLDDQGYVTLNGITVVDNLSWGNSGALTTFSIDPSDLVAGTNVLQIVEDNSDNNEEGVRFEGTVQSVPEPKSIFVIGMGIAVLGFLKTRRS